MAGTLGPSPTGSQLSHDHHIMVQHHPHLRKPELRNVEWTPNTGSECQSQEQRLVSHKAPALSPEPLPLSQLGQGLESIILCLMGHNELWLTSDIPSGRKNSVNK